MYYIRSHFSLGSRLYSTGPDPDGTRIRVAGTGSSTDTAKFVLVSQLS